MKIYLWLATMAWMILLSASCVNETSSKGSPATLSPDDKKATAAATEAPTVLPALTSCPTLRAVCDFSLGFAQSLQAGEIESLVRDAVPTTVTCPANGTARPQTGVCSLHPQETITAYAVGEKSSRYEDLAGFQEFLSTFVASGTQRTAAARAIGCPVVGSANGDCGSFAAATLELMEGGKLVDVLIIGILFPAGNHRHARPGPAAGVGDRG